MVSLARTIYAAPTSDPAELLDFPDQAEVEHQLLEAFIPAAYHDRPTAPETPLISIKGQYAPEQARRWLMFLARHLDTLTTPDLAWWQLADAIPRSTRGTSVGLTAGLVFGFVGVLAGAGLADTTYRLVAVLVWGIGFGSATGLSYGVSKRPAPLRVEARLQGTLGSFLLRLVLGLVAGVGVGLGFGLPYERVLAVGLAFGFALAASVWLNMPADMTQVPSPGVVLKQDRTATFSFSLLMALPPGLAGEFVVGFPIENNQLVSIELAFGVIGGAVAVLAGALVGAVAGAGLRHV